MNKKLFKACNQEQGFASHLSVFLILSLFTAINFSPYLIFYEKLPSSDWDYFNGLSYIIDLAIFKYHTFPLHDPYTCGGVDILANPQSYIFSPLILFNFIFSPYWGNVFSLMFCAILGGFGMIKLLNLFAVERKLSIIGALIFLSCNWFGMHFLEGHIAFRSMQLIPWAIYLIFCLEKNIKYWIYFSLLMAFFLLDGGIYSFNFCLLFLIIALILRNPSLKKLIRIACQNPKITLLILLAFTMLIIPKALPLLLLHNKRLPELHFYAYSFNDVFLAFLYPLNLLQDQKITDGFEKNWRMHEYVCYVGIFSIIVFFLSQKWHQWQWSKWRAQKSFALNSDKTLLAFLLISLWIGIGFGELFNPWTIFMFTPFLNNSHVQSRFLIFFFIFFTILLVRALAALKNRYFFATLILLELTFVRIYPAFIELRKMPQADYYNELRDLKKHNITETVHFLPKPQIYFSAGKSSHLCYDRAQNISPNIAAISDKNYLGEFYSLSGAKGLELQEYSADKISAIYSGRAGETFIFNTNYLLGWQGENEKDYEIKSINGLMAVTFNKSPVEFTAKYRSKYLKYILLSFLFAIFIYAALLVTLKKYAKNTV